MFAYLGLSENRLPKKMMGPWVISVVSFFPINYDTLHYLWGV